MTDTTSLLRLSRTSRGPWAAPAQASSPRRAAPTPAPPPGEKDNDEAAFFPQEAATDVLLVPTVNPDNNQHSPNENLRLGHFFDGILTFAGVLLTR